MVQAIIKEEQHIREFLANVTVNPELHAKWLNTLSFMENMGTTKIYKSQSGLGMSKTVLQHAAEESRHALFFKKLVTRYYGDVCPTYGPEHLLCPYNTWIFFQRLDAMVDLKIKKMDRPENSDYMKYLYVTLIIEERASAVYDIYEEILAGNGSEISLKSVITEEEGHMETTIAELKKYDVDFAANMDDFRIKEHKYFNKLMKYLQRSAGMNK